jgi:fumarylacetoacetate (FAA) hydrolase
MKLASRRNGQPDGQLVVVSRDLTRYTRAEPIAQTMQQALDHWEALAPRLQSLADQLETGSVPDHRFHEREALAPLPRAYQFLDGSAYVNHVELVRKARGAVMPERFWTDPLMYQGCSDHFLAPRDPIPQPAPGGGLDFEAELAVITGPVRAGVSPAEVGSAIKLVMLLNDISLRHVIAAELPKGFGFVNGKPASACSPVAVTPDELGASWDGGRLHRPMLVTLNNQLFGSPDCGTDMIFDFPTLIAHAAATRSLMAGSIIGSGTISNRDPAGAVGYACLAERRAVECIQTGASRTPFLAPGDVIRIEVRGPSGQSIFGAIEQRVA